MSNVTVNITGLQILDGMQAALLRLKAPADEAALRPFVDDFKPDKHYCALLGEKRQKRSLTANAYAWTLLGKLAEVLSAANPEHPQKAEDIYRDLIRDVDGADSVVQVSDAAAEELVRLWCSRGIGWQAVLVDSAAGLPGVSIYRLYKGSSEYDSRQMSRLLALIVEECKLQGIPTETPAEIARMVSLMEAADGKQQ